jgi:hypothetical protein
MNMWSEITFPNGMLEKSTDGNLEAPVGVTEIEYLAAMVSV